MTPARTVPTLASLALAVLLSALLGCGGVSYNDIDKAVRAENVERRLEKINGRYRLGATDGVALSIPNAPNLSGSHTIRPDGFITLEYIGDIYIEGMTPMQAAQAVRESLKAYFLDIDVTLNVTGFNSQKYYIFGEVNTVGDFTFDGDVDVLKAVARAKGITNRAAWDRIRLVRATSTTRRIYKINFADIVKSGEWQTNIPLNANDILYIPPTYIARVVYFIDNVLYPLRSVFGATTTFTVTGGQAP